MNRPYVLQKIIKSLLQGRIFLSCLFLYLFLSCSGCDFIYGLLDKEGAEEKDLVGEVVPFQSNEKIREIQELLDLYGYDSGKTDGVLGGRTRNAIERFQKDNALKATHFVDKETWKKMTELRSYGLVDGTKLNVAAVQYVLKELGYNPGPQDGKLGQKTIDAVKAFQKKQGLKVDGKIGYKTLSKLASFIVKQ